MKRIVTLLLLILAILIGPAFAAKLTIDPNASGQKAPTSDDPTADKRLAQKITYKVKLRQVSDIADDLSKLTGIKFLAGKNSSDWRVREDKMNMMVQDIPIAYLMNSIARVMKFKWVRGGKSPNWTYRLVEDQKALDAVLQRIEKERQAGLKLRKSNMDWLSKADHLTQEELAKLRKDDPMNYLQVKFGTTAAVCEFFNQAPEIKQAWLEGRELTINASKLSPAARAAFVDAIVKRPICNIPYRSSDVPEDREQLRSAVEDAFAKGNITVGKDCNSSYMGYISSAITELPLLTAPKQKSELLVGQTWIRAYVEKRPLYDVFKETRDELRKLRAEESKIETPSPLDDPRPVHPDDPALHQGIKDKIDEQVLTGLAARLEKVSGYAVVTDCLKGRRSFSYAKDTELQKVLDETDKSLFYNWDMHNGVIEMWSRRWYWQRDQRICLAWLERLKDTIKTTGTLDLDDLAEIAQLNDSQFWSVDREPLLRPACRCIVDNRDCLKFFSTLSSTQRALLFSEPGLAFTGLSPEQQQTVLNIALSKNTSIFGEGALPDLGLRISASRIQNGKRYIYILRAFTRFGPIPGEYKFRTPLCPQLKPESNEAQPAAGENL